MRRPKRPRPLRVAASSSDSTCEPLDARPPKGRAPSKAHVARPPWRCSAGAPPETQEQGPAAEHLGASAARCRRLKDGAGGSRALQRATCCQGWRKHAKHPLRTTRNRPSGACGTVGGAARQAAGAEQMPVAHPSGPAVRDPVGHQRPHRATGVEESAPTRHRVDEAGRLALNKKKGERTGRNVRVRHGFQRLDGHGENRRLLGGWGAWPTGRAGKLHRDRRPKIHPTFPRACPGESRVWRLP